MKEGRRERKEKIETKNLYLSKKKTNKDGKEATWDLFVKNT